MADFTTLYADTETRMARVLEKLGLELSDSERAEVMEFLEAREYGLALETLAAILVEEAKPIAPPVMREIEEMASAMSLKDELFMHDLYNRYDRQWAMMR